MPFQGIEGGGWKKVEKIEPKSGEKTKEKTVEERSEDYLSNLHLRENTNKFFKSINEFYSSPETINSMGEEISERAQEKYDLLRSELGALSVTKNHEHFRQNPHELAESISVVANSMETARQNISDPDMDELGRKEASNTYELTKKLFMESCKKLYPNESVSTHLLSRKINDIAKSLNESNLMGGGNLDFIKNPEMLFQGKPKELLILVDSAFDAINSNISNKLYYDTIAESDNTVAPNIEMPENEQKRMEIGVKSLYQLEMLRDQIRNKLYGSDKTPEEIAKMEKIKSEI